MSKIHDVIWSDHKIEEFWSNIVELNSKDETWFTYIAGDAILNFVKQKVGLKNSRVLDYGTGKGFLINHLLKIEGISVSVCDTSIESLNNINNKYKDGVELSALIDKLPCDLPDNFFDVVFLLEVVEHLSDTYLESTLQEINRVLKPNGKLIISTPNDEDLDLSKIICPDCGCKFHRWQHLRSWNRSSLPNFVEKFSFKTEGIWELDIMSYNSGYKGLFFSLKSYIKAKWFKTRYPNLIHISEKIHG